jgi:transcription elongation factor Elf1
MEFESEKFFTCPFCGESISMVLEELYGAQSYVEDCQVCCNPIQISFDVEDGEIVDIRAERA